ncbi:MAG: phosphoribosylamine--glycine ligase [Betaproteobacteria bacterium SG8_41]|jgi:phosphoribosylamine--glycine ligase|nr:MAG: phosphoribosylamine--glycine ligase [Betaproteobacteria bacterium SG8_41]
MKLLVIGAGGREHALAWKLARSPRISRVFVAPGNAGTAREDGLVNVPITAPPELIDFAQKEGVAFTVVGPEAPLAEGVVDAFQAAGLKIFGPKQSAARLESSKEYAKSFMARYGIPTAQYAVFEAAAPAHAYLEEHRAPIVIKADGLAAGKGVVVAMSADEAHSAVDLMLTERRLGASGSRIVIEEYLDGEEASFIALCDGRHALPLATSQDHKRLLDGDCGPNTGGMGAYSPAPVVTPAVHAKAMREVIQPALSGMQREGTPYVGFLYAGLMISRDGTLRVLEFNCRMGDPETQPIIMRLKSDLVGMIEHALAGTLDRAEAEWDTRVALGVVLAAHGYPEAPRKGDAIRGLPAPQDDYHIFHAGTALNGADIVTNGGRVLCVTALGSNVRAARRRAYEIAEQVRFEGMQYRRDIGHRALSGGVR